MVIRTLDELEPGEKGQIVKVGGGRGIRRRLLDMGVVAGAEIEVERVAPLGDPVEVRVKGYDLALRKQEAADIQVEVKYMKRDMMPLSMVAGGSEVEVAAVRAGWGLQRRLADMGMTPGTRIKLVSSRSGPVVVEVRGSRLALGAGVAHKIMVVVPGKAGER